MLIYLSIALFFASFIASLFGIGGGVLYTPFQLWLGVPFGEASTVSFVLIMVTSLSATILYRKSDRVDWLFAIMLEIPTTIGAFIGGFVSHYFNSYFLSTVLVALLIFTAFFMIKSINFDTSFYVTVGDAKKRWWHLVRKWENRFYFLDMRFIIPTMIIVGALISMAGISGGVLKIPIMVLLFKVPMSIAIGTSAFMVGLTAAAGLIGHIIFETISWRKAFILLIPVFIGAQIGSRVSVAVKADKLKWLYGWFLVMVAIITLLRVWNIL